MTLSLVVSWFLGIEGAAAQKPRINKAGVVSMEKQWKEIGRLISEQKHEAAYQKVVEIEQKSRQMRDIQNWTKALVKQAQLRIGLHGYETAVRSFRQKAWPEDRTSRNVLNLFYAWTLVEYFNIYSWEIEQRQRIVSQDEVDLKAWTRDQIYSEAQKAFLLVWQDRASLGRIPVSAWKDYLVINSYPDGVRSTLRDTVSYMYAQLLANSTLWTPAQSNELYWLDLKALLGGIVPRRGLARASGQAWSRLFGKDRDFDEAKMLSDPHIHPVLKYCWILSDLEIWHTLEGNRTAVLEAALERLRMLHAVFNQTQDRDEIIINLKKRLAGFKDIPWWAMGQAQLAELIRDSEKDDAFVQARKIAVSGYKAYPKSPGGQRCLYIARSIEAPDYSLESMLSDAAGRRSFALQHKNLNRLYFRAYPVDIRNQIASARDYNLIPSWNEIKKIVRSHKPQVSWTVDLPKTPDFEFHRTYVSPPIRKNGFYVVVASTRRDFRDDHNRILGLSFQVTNLVVMTQSMKEGGVEVRIVDGGQGAPVPGASVELYRFDWHAGHQRVAAKTTDSTGLVTFSQKKDKLSGRHSYFLLTDMGDDLALSESYLGIGKNPQERQMEAALVFTDRSVYRPGQQLYWKVVAYNGGGGQARYQVSPSKSVTVYLKDSNGETVEERVIATNAYGSAFGNFMIPAGRALGAWRIECSPVGQSWIRVEEYKRPTFEVTLQDPNVPMRLNRPAVFAGLVKYYFGLPVTSGRVSWNVTRMPVYPHWWGWYYGRTIEYVRTQTIAAGSARLDDQGGFKVAFTPEADERRAQEGVTYLYRIQADVTDEGGETRSTERSFRLGFASIEATIHIENAFVRAGDSTKISVQRNDLNGVARQGEGRWRLLSLRQPQKTLLPAEQPMPASRSTKPRSKSYQTEGDLLRPRWEEGYSHESIMSMWKDADQVAGGKIVHAANGQAAFELSDLEPGAYRIRYETLDEFGKTCEAVKDLIVAGKQTPVKLPAVLLVEHMARSVGDTARVLVHSGLEDQTMYLDVTHRGVLRRRYILNSNKDENIIALPIGMEDRGGLGLRLVVLRDHQLMVLTRSIHVPWEDRKLSVEFASFRDKIRPGAREVFRVVVKDHTGALVGPDTAELLAYMYDKSLDIFAPHDPPLVVNLYPTQTWSEYLQTNLGRRTIQYQGGVRFVELPGYPMFDPDRLEIVPGHGIGGMGLRTRRSRLSEAASAEPMDMEMDRAENASPPASLPSGARAASKSGSEMKMKQEPTAAGGGSASQPVVELRSQFAETAFWQPHLILGKDGEAVIEFEVPDSVTAWNVWVHAVTRDLRGGYLQRETRSVKDLMVRPYLPRFLREGDTAELKVVVNNASDKTLLGKVGLEIHDPDTQENLMPAFGFKDGSPQSRPFRTSPGMGTSVSFFIKAPFKTAGAAFKVTAVSGDTSDGELRVLPVLPGRTHLVQSRFVTLHNDETRVMKFEEMKDTRDPSRINEALIINIDAQLFYGVLESLPYLINYPYECTEQILNRFVSTGIVASLYESYPAVARMAKQLGRRTTRLETWDAIDPNRKISLEETPWLMQARGGTDTGSDLLNALDPRIARAERKSSLSKLEKAQTAIGAFPWWPGGPPSPYMTLYILYGLAKASEFNVEVPQDMVRRGWKYLAEHFRQEYDKKMTESHMYVPFLTFLVYTSTCYPDPAWMADALTKSERNKILEYCFKHWREQSPYLKGLLALTLHRMGRAKDARLVFDSVMDSAKTKRDEGTFWAPEDRAWLWYQDTIETHAFAIRVLTELKPDDARRHGLVQWLFLNKKLNHWKSTRATAEVIYALIHYLKQEGALGSRENISVETARQKTTFTFAPDRYTGKKNQLVIPGEKIDPATCSDITVSKKGKGFAFASASWHFSTEKLPEKAQGDFFGVSRTYYKRKASEKETVLVPLTDGDLIRVGDEVEVHLSLKAKHASEYVHLRDPRPAGLEPVNLTSGYRWDLGLSYYEEIRDSGENFFFEWLPAGEYTFKYRIRAAMAGTFKVAPATLQSMYAPEFNAYSTGSLIEIRPAS